MEDKRVPADSGMVIGVSGLDRLSCPTCGAYLEWVEQSVEGKVKLTTDGALVPDYTEQKDIWRATTKEAFCCGVIYKADPWASFRITATPEE